MPESSTQCCQFFQRTPPGVAAPLLPENRDRAEQERKFWDSLPCFCFSGFLHYGLYTLNAFGSPLLGHFIMDAVFEYDDDNTMAAAAAAAAGHAILGVPYTVGRAYVDYRVEQLSSFISHADPEDTIFSCWSGEPSWEILPKLTRIQCVVDAILEVGLITSSVALGSEVFGLELDHETLLDTAVGAGVLNTAVAGWFVLSDYCCK